MNYNLNVLNDKEFEQLCKDILEKDLGISLQSFKKGKDKGVDLRYAKDRENKIIIQAKHYINSKFSDLKFQMINVEIPKIKSLSPTPEKYILITSLPLNPNEVDTLVKELYPYVKNSQDIYGLDRISSILSNSINEKTTSK